MVCMFYLIISFQYMSILMLQVLFRYAIAIFKYLEESVLRQSDYMSIFHTLRNGLEELKDIRKLTQVGTGNKSCSMLMPPHLVCTFRHNFISQSK